MASVTPFEPNGLQNADSFGNDKKSAAALVLRGVGQQGDGACLLDGAGQLALKRR